MSRRTVMPLLLGLAATFAAESARAVADGPAAFRVVDVAVWDVLNLRTGPGTRYRVVDTIPHNGRGIENLAARMGNWLRVRYGGRIGWVNSRYLAADPWSDGHGARWRVVDVAFGDVLNVRAGPSADHPAVGVVPPDGRGIVLIGGCHGDWCRIRHADTRGWVNTRFLAPEA